MKNATVRRREIPVTCHVSPVTQLLIAGAVLFLMATSLRAQAVALSSATNFTSVEYFDAPHERQVKTRLSGAEASQQADNLNVYVIKQFRLETFDVAGKLEMVVSAPECVYDMAEGVASSAGPLQVLRGDGKYRLTGEGFLWHQADRSLNISNNVHTVIERPPAAAKSPDRRAAKNQTVP